MQMSELNSLGQQVLLVSFVLSAVFGAIAQRTHFCTMGAVSDVVNMGDWTRMRQWGLAIGVAMIGFGALVYLGRVDAAKTLYSTTRVQWLSALVGGAMFGFGMVLASGCGSKTLVRIGGGSLKSLVVFVVMGVASYATLRGVTAVARVATVDRVAVDMAQGTLMSAGGGCCQRPACAVGGPAAGAGAGWRADCLGHGGAWFPRARQPAGRLRAGCGGDRHVVGQRFAGLCGRAPRDA
jgi:uncharacterized membrane protein YedE/YeeE